MLVYKRSGWIRRIAEEVQPRAAARSQHPRQVVLLVSVQFYLYRLRVYEGAIANHRFVGRFSDNRGSRRVAKSFSRHLQYLDRAVAEQDILFLEAEAFGDSLFKCFRFF